MQWESGTWNAIEGAIYNAAGSTGMWTLVSAALCVLALIVGSRHELGAYKKADGKK